MKMLIKLQHADGEWERISEDELNEMGWELLNQWAEQGLRVEIEHIEVA